MCGDARWIVQLRGRSTKPCICLFAFVATPSDQAERLFHLAFNGCWPEWRQTLKEFESNLQHGGSPSHAEILPCFGPVGCAEKHTQNKRLAADIAVLRALRCAVAHPSASPTRLNMAQLELLRGEIAMTVIVGTMTLLVGLIATTAALELGALARLGS